MNMASDSGIRVAAAISTADQAARAVDQVCADVLQQLQAAPDLALLFVSSQYAPVDEQLARQACRLLGTEQLIGGTGESIVGVGVEIEQQPAVSLWAARLDGVAILPMHLRLERAADGASIVGWPERLSSDWPADATMLVIGEPFSFPADLMVERLNEDHRDLRVVGGMASGAAEPGTNRIFIGTDCLTEGAAVVLMNGAVRVTTVVSQGCRPIGHHLIVTRSEGNLVHELGGQPALLQLKKIFDTLSTTEKRMVNSGLFLGRVVNEYQDRFEQGDFLVRNVLGIDPDSGSIAVGDFLRPGQTVQFHVRDHQTAHDEMHQLLARARDGSHGVPRGALLFTCNGRGSRLFSEPHHDARQIQKTFGDIPLAGFFAAGELGPIGGKNFMHGFTASVALFGTV